MPPLLKYLLCNMSHDTRSRFSGHASTLSNGYDKDLSDEVSSDVNAETRPSVIRVRLESRDKASAGRSSSDITTRIAGTGAELIYNFDFFQSIIKRLWLFTTTQKVGMLK